MALMSALAVLVLLGASPAALAEEAKPAAGRLSWEDSMDAALARAKKENKYVLLDFYTDWCGWCKRLDRDVFAKDEFKSAAGQVIGVKINAEKSQENRALARSFGVSSYPRLFVLDKEGRTLERIKGYLALKEFTSLVGQVQAGNSEFNRLRTAAADPNNLQAIHSFATFLTETSQREESIPYWQQVHDIALERLFGEPDSTSYQYFHRRALLNLGLAFSAVGLPDVGKQNLTDVTLSYAGSNEAAEALLALAEIDVASGNTAGANAHLTALATEYPRSRAHRNSQPLRAKLRRGGAQ
jgi:thioredoxin-related protein